MAVMRHFLGHLLLVTARLAGAPEEEIAPRRARLPCQRCRCGCPRRAHEHYRKGTNCGLCECIHYQRRWFWHRRA